MNSQELKSLRSEDLLSLARNEAAQDRHKAVRILVERGSSFAGHPEVRAEASALIYRDPGVLKTADPGEAATAHKLPGLLDVVAREVVRSESLERRSKDLETKHGDLASALATEARQRALGLRELCDQVTTGLTDMTIALTDRQESVDEQLQALRDRADNYDARLKRLERSKWRKFVDWLKGLF